MWGDPDPDPGGSRSDKTLSPQELSDLKDQNEQQLLLIAQLKEMLRKEQSSVSQEKVEEYVNTLNRNKAKRSQQKKDGSGVSHSRTSSSVGIEASKKERINLLRQQLEENKARLAERGKSQKGIEEMVTQLQAQLKDNQTLISSTPLNVSLVETKSLDYNENTPQKDLYNILLTKERKITELMNKSQKLEGTVLDLQENLKEKDSVIDARTKAITLMTDSLSKKGKSTLDTLDETKEQMKKMQENFVTLEADMKARQLALLNDLKMKNFEISDLQEANTQLEKEKLALEKKLSELERSEVPVTPSDDSVLEELRNELFELQIENQNYLKKINELESKSHENSKMSDHNELEMKNLKAELDKLNMKNQDHIQTINELESRTFENTIEQNLKIKIEESHQQIEALQKKYNESCQHNAESLSRITQLELQLEALSKLKNEGETVLDSSEDTRKKIEEENSKLLDDNQRLSIDNSQNLSRISVLENQLEETLTDLKLLKSANIDSSDKISHEDNEEIAKLKKQLDESNKNMIKMRAMQKGKIKELNKKLDQFRKMDDSNTLIGQLQNEISKLNEKIAELEDEKGNLQLKMVESTGSSKGDSVELEEQIKQLEEKLTGAIHELEEKNKVIEILESEVLSLKDDLIQKSEEAVKVSTHVTSEMSYINYEEQIEKIESEKNKLIEELDAIKVEQEELLKEIESLKKEKQDMATKLDNYIQENMDLIDKLEKLSAEKVSSAESIEIVEGLTQQEKLELAAYQKHINPEEPLKCPDEDNLDPPAELNESVLQLSEDTVELLQKIEMFTQERKEVMQKMEALKEENNALTLKVKEIENNRDILEETYEQLQNEKEALANEKQELLEKLERSQKLEAFEKETEQSAEVLNSKLKELQIKCEALVQENDELKRTLKDFDSKMQEKYDLEKEFREMIEKNDNIETKLLTNREEIKTYELTIAKNKDELIRSSEIINDINKKLEDRDKDIEELHTNINDLNNVIEELQDKNSNYELMESELQNLKTALIDQISQADNYETEMAQSNETMKKLKDELVQLNRRILELENELELKDSEIEKVNKDIHNRNEIIRNLQSEIEEKNHKFKTVSEEMKNKYLQLQQQLDNNGNSLKQQIDDLTHKNKDQLEKMKKIAANLKKKSQAYQELEDQYKSQKEKWESETNEKNSVIESSQEKVASLTQELENITRQLKIKLEENETIKNQVIVLKQNVDVLEQNNADQQHYIQELKHKQEKLQEVNLQQEMSASLHEEIDNSFPKNVPEEKIRELELLLETNEFELSHHKERIDKLQECIRKLEEEKALLGNRNAELVEKLDLTSSSFKEKALLEDQLELRLAEVSANDEVLSKKLQETQRELEELRKKNQDYEELIKKLKIKLKKAHDKVTELKTVQNNLQELETANQELRNQINILETNQRHIQNENESLQRRNMSDYEKIEADYQIQLEELLKTKNDLIIENEKLVDKLKEVDDREQELIMELDEYKLRLDQSENSHIEEINRLNDDIKVVKDELEKKHLEHQEARAELKVIHEKLQQSSIEIDRLTHELNSTKEQLVNFNDHQEKLAISLSENNELNEKLRHTNERLKIILKESESCQDEQDILNKKLQVSSQNNDTLKNEIEKLKQEIQTLEFAKSSSEPTSIVDQKLDEPKSFQQVQQITFEQFSQQNVSQTRGAVPTFHWPDQQQTTAVDLFDNLSQPQSIAKSFELNTQQSDIASGNANENVDKSFAEIDNLKQELNASNNKLQAALQEITSLTIESDKLKQKVQALQFAKASLEASYESSQKLDNDKSVDMSHPVILEELPHKNLIQTQKVPVGSSVPLFDAFVKSNETLFDVFTAPPSGDNQWFLQQPSQSTNTPPSDTTSRVSEDSNAVPLSQPVIENGREALLKKIKALEVLLYNIDKEKEIALDQCIEMVNELTQVLCDQVNARTQEVPVSDLESQIMSQDDIDSVASNKQTLQKTEYAPINKDAWKKTEPVKEEVIVPQKAYLCFDDEDIPVRQDQGFADIDSQIVSEKDIIEAASNKKQLQSLEYERVDRSLGEQQHPIVEPLAQSKHAYLCYKEDKPQSFEAFEENDDGWGWGPEEAKLEEEHMSNVENTPQVKALLVELQQLKENIKVLQIERENHLEEIKQLQVKSGKLIKKCKELKAKSDQASTSKKQDDGGFFDLNETIQEELKAQVQQLEKKIKEITSEFEKEKQEKAGLLKRVDVLTSANERMMEMKEIQDTEVLRLQRKHKEAVEKLQEYEWNSDGFGERATKVNDEPQPSTSGSGDQGTRIQELENTIKDLTLDNEELQTLLEEQSARRIEAEKNKSTGNDLELAELRSLNETLHKELDAFKLKSAEVHSELTGIEQEKNKLVEKESELGKMLQSKQVEIQALEDNLRMAEDMCVQHQRANEDLVNELLALNTQIFNKDTLLDERNLIINDLQNNLEELNIRKVELDQDIARLNNDLSIKTEVLKQNDNTKVEISSQQAEIERLNLKISEKEKVIDDLNNLVDSIEKEKTGEEEIVNKLKEELCEHKEMLKSIESVQEQKDSEYVEELQKKSLQLEEYQKMVVGLQEYIKEIEVTNVEKTQEVLEMRNLSEELHSRSLENEQKERRIQELELKASDSNKLTLEIQTLSQNLDNKTKEIETLAVEKLAKDLEVQQLLASLQNKEQEYEERTNTLVNELNANWLVQVDQRGTDVAESWKMHLEMIEKDYTATQEKLKSDITELEEKCNILVNENNELRKNVDQEIRNEVDKISALHHQISNQHQVINSLNMAIQEKDKQIEEIQNNLSNYLSLEGELQALRNEIIEKEHKLSSINIIIETTQKQFDEKREVVEEIVSILEKNASSPISYEKNDILNEFQRQLKSSGEKEKEISKLDRQIKELEEKLERISGENKREVTGLNQIIEDLERELGVIHEKEAEIVRISTELNNIQLEKHELEQHISKIRQDKENLLPEYEKLKQEHSNCQAAIEDYRQKVQDYYNTNATLQQVLEERNGDIKELNQKMLELQESAKNDSNKEIERLNADIVQAKGDIIILQETLTACQKELLEATQELAQKSQKLETTNQNLYYYQQNYTAFEEEINRLKGTLDQRERDYSNSLEMLKNNQLMDIQRHYDELLSNKDLDVQTLQAQGQELIKNNLQLSERLNQEFAVRQELEYKLTEQTQLVDEDTKQLEELKLIIEDQVAKIEELKKELFDKSNQYDSLIAEMDVGRQPVTQQPIASASMNPLDVAKKNRYTEEDLAEPVSRAELDLALYMLHQRDVRCEELTVELTQLLEERDTLQLRLSNSIREKEELRRTLADHSSVPTTSSNKENSPPRSKSSAIFLAASGTELAKDPLESDQSLATKLSELKVVNYKKDKTFVDDQDARRLQQLAILQQHINEASKLPPEAAARLVDASYTLSRDVQSPSKVLLNWLWGKSPPKANDS